MLREQVVKKDDLKGKVISHLEYDIEESGRLLMQFEDKSFCIFSLSMYSGDIMLSKRVISDHNQKTLGLITKEQYEEHLKEVEVEKERLKKDKRYQQYLKLQKEFDPLFKDV